MWRQRLSYINMFLCYINNHGVSNPLRSQAANNTHKPKHITHATTPAPKVPDLGALYAITIKTGTRIEDHLGRAKIAESLLMSLSLLDIGPPFTVLWHRESLLATKICLITHFLLD